MMPRLKMEDLHTAILNKNTEFEILNAQLRLKERRDKLPHRRNKQITKLKQRKNEKT
jgi:hypothetical protein